MRLGIIDLGTNSIRFDLQQIRAGGRTRRLHREKMMVRLGQGVFETGKLDSRAAERTLEALRSFAKTAEEFHAERILAFGTSALRESSDADQFIARVKRETGIQIRVISGGEEARLIASGILSHENLPKGTFALLDIGGGSAEAIACRGKNILHSQSFGLGVARLQQLYFKRSLPIQDLRKHIKSVLLPITVSEHWPRCRILMGSSGTVQALLKINKRYFKKEGALSRKDLGRLVREMKDLTPLELLSIPGMEPKRVDLILPGAILVQEFMEALDSDRLIATEYSLRDGILEEEIEKVSKKVGRFRSGVALEAAKKKIQKLGMTGTHTEKVVAFASLLFDRLSRVHHLRAQWKELLLIAAYFHDVGENVSARDHAAHSSYIARNSDLPGIADSDLEFVASLCRFHANGKPPFREVPFQKDRKRMDAFLKLLSIFRIADALDRGHRSAVQIKSVRVRKKSIHLSLKSQGSLDLELLRLETKKELFEGVFGKMLIVDWKSTRSRAKK